MTVGNGEQLYASSQTDSPAAISSSSLEIGVSSSPPSATLSSLQASTEAGVSSLTESPQSHPMITRSKAGISKRNPKYANMARSNIPLQPRSVHSALSSPDWKAAMLEELDALLLIKHGNLFPGIHW